MRYIGIDPGLSGGIAAVHPLPHGKTLAWACPMPKTDEGILRALEKITESGTVECFAMIENVWSSPQMGVASAFTFGSSDGRLRMALVACGIPFNEVAPIKWQNVMQVRTPKDVRAELGHKDKNINKARAAELFPKLKVTHAIADALLLAEYAWRCAGLLSPPASNRTLTNGKTRRTEKGKAPGQVVEEDEAEGAEEGEAAAPHAAAARDEDRR